MLTTILDEQPAGRASLGNVRELPAGSVVVEGVRLIDGTGGQPLPGSNVVIDDHTIVRVGGPSTFAPADAYRIDGSGMTMIPGLIDAHVHLTGQRSADPYQRYFGDAPEVRLFRAAADAQAAMAMGYTTMRDCGLTSFGIELRRSIGQGSLLGPRIGAAVHGLSPTGGSCDWPDLPLEFVRETRLRGYVVDDAQEATRAVRRNFRDGATFTKVFVSSGNLAVRQAWPPKEIMTEDELRAIVDATHAHGALCAGHCMGAASVERAVRCGVDTIEHGLITDHWEVLDVMAEHGSILVPTLSIFHHLSGRGKATTPASSSGWATELARRIFDQQLEMVRRARAAGVAIAAGSDTGSRYGVGSNALELELLCQAGLTPLEAIAAATGTSARACGWSDRVGTVEAGRRADFVLLGRDPTEAIATLQDPATIRSVFTTPMLL